ncbi:MAG: (2Fe-2S) ferredoxin domain-containing protein [Chroococcidiopsidaceae cyanobacterium CP_BM_ER_R8_30]|nr:(2Fe-2S) ferredoxin domain-containing protein [Chroococcidiopsidaceae cyanobacterium CP_BM_ER_R8_30]
MTLFSPCLVSKSSFLLAAALSDRGLAEQFVVKGTGCLKKCSLGPNLVMPDKTRYSRVKVDQIPKLIGKHYSHTESIDNMTDPD